MRLHRISRLASPRVWRALLLGVTDPANDETWQFVVRRGRRDFLDQPRPWFAASAIAYLEDILRPGFSVFEWGAGGSSLWFEQQGCRVTTIEHDARWAEEVAARARGKVEVILRDAAATGYVSPAVELTEFDVIVVDGRRREDCVRGASAALRALASSKTVHVILDDSHRAAYAAAIDLLSDAAADQRHFAGLSPMLTPRMTSIFRFGPN
jgi:hypothetical protein